MNLVTVLKRVFLPKAARQESKLLGMNYIGTITTERGLETTEHDKHFGNFFRHMVRT